MGVETAQELAGFFDPDEFGEACTYMLDGVAGSFNAIISDAHTDEVNEGRTHVSTSGLRLICGWQATQDLRQGMIVSTPRGDREIFDIQQRGDVAVVLVHEV